MPNNRCIIIFLLYLVHLLSVQAQDEDFVLSVIHINDFHARYDPISLYSGGRCLPGENEAGNCFGGISRIVTKVNDLSNEMPNPLLLNGGDTFQGTMFYTLFKWNISVTFMNKIDFDATGVGNHEFDDGIAGATPYFEQLVSPLVAANMDASLVPELQGKYVPSVTIDRFEGHKVGIIGCIYKNTPEIANTGDLIFYDEIESVAAESAKLKSEGVDIIILVSHSGYNTDQSIALNNTDIDIIVGAHSHSFLYSGPDPQPSVEYPVGDYPTVIEQEGRKVLIVQAYAYSKYVGALKVHFDANGEVVSWEGEPIILDYTVVEDPQTKAELQPWSDEVNAYGNKELGVTYVFLDSYCYQKECSLGSFLCDGQVYEQLYKTTNPDYWTAAAISIMNPGGIRAPIGDSPSVTIYDLTTAQPFNNTVDTIELKGKDIVTILEMSAAPDSRAKGTTPLDSYDIRGFLQVSGIHVTYNMSLPAGSRIVDLQVLCAKCREPKYHPIDYEEWYNIAMPSFLSAGGDGYYIIAENGRNLVKGDIDVNVSARYIARESPITQGVDGRINIVQ